MGQVVQMPLIWYYIRHMDPHAKQRFATYIRNFIFGVEDGMVSNVGLLSGVAAANVSHSTILLTGVVLVFVGGFSMAAGSYLSEHSAEEFVKGEEASHRQSFMAALTMFVSYMISGFIPLFPYLFWQGTAAFYGSIIISLIVLFILGVSAAYFFGTNKIKGGMKILVVGGAAIAIGIISGKLINRLTGAGY